MSFEKIYKTFKLPIEYNEKKKQIKSHLISDLELVKTVNEKETPMFNHLLQPKTDLGKLCIDKWKNYYTPDKKYLSNTQKLLSTLPDFNYNEKLMTKMFQSWTKMKNNQNFIEYYQYIEFDKLKWLNGYSSFLFLLSFYNISSPVLNLVTPIALMILPFILIKMLGMQITATNYISILKRELAKHPIGKLFTSFGRVSLNQKFYLLVGAGLYIYNFYQNILSCIRFYKNLNFISNEFKTFKEYLENTITNMNVIIPQLEGLEMYEDFLEDVKCNRQYLIEILESIKNVPTCKVNMKTFMCIGETMKYFYKFYSSEQFDTAINFSLGFNSYLESLKGIKSNINNNIINKATLVKNKSKTIINIKQIYNPSLKSPIKNDINFKKNKIITGPNAAGKTTILKSTILNLVITQQIGFGYYESAKITPVDYLHCYINIPDSCSRDSLFQSEANRCKEILDIIEKNPEDKHFCVFDELFSGTNPYEAICTAKAYLEFISKNKNVKFLLTTHFIRLCRICSKEFMENYNMKIERQNEQLIYTYKIQKGISKVKGGIHVLQQLKYNPDIIENAKKTIENLE